MSSSQSKLSHVMSWEGSKIANFFFVTHLPLSTANTSLRMGIVGNVHPKSGHWDSVPKRIEGILENCTIFVPK